MKINLWVKIIFITFFTILINVFVYFAFVNIYSSHLLNIDNFRNQYESSVYQYRWLSTNLLIWIYNLLESLPYKINLRNDFWSENAEANMLFAYAFLNTFFLILSNITLLLITEAKKIVAHESEKIMIIVIATLVIGISQYILTPYDCSSYFFLFFYIFLFLKYLENRSHIILFFLLLIIVISTANRESSALSISFAGVVLYQLFGLKKQTIFPIACMIVAYLTTYIGLRFVMGSFEFASKNLFFENIGGTRNMFGILFWGVFFMLSLLISNNKQAVKNILIFHLLSLPYILTCFYTGILYETRLYVPIFLSCLVLSKFQIRKKHSA